MPECERLSETLSENLLPSKCLTFGSNTIATTIAAQIAVLPLLLYDTGNLSLVAIPANLLTMPMVPLAMGFSALAGFAGIIFSKIIPFLGISLAFPAYVANAYIIFIARSVSVAVCRVYPSRISVLVSYRFLYSTYFHRVVKTFFYN